MKTKRIAIILIAAVLILSASTVYAQPFTSIGKGILHILGIGLTVDPEKQTAPINTGTAVNTSMVMPDVGTEIALPVAPQDLLVVAELSGPGITAKTIAAKPGQQLIIPPLPEEGTYALNNIRLMSGDKVILYANPSMALIDTIKKLLITQVTSRALSIDEIEALGITINPDNFTAYKFTVGVATVVRHGVVFCLFRCVQEMDGADRQTGKQDDQFKLLSLLSLVHALCPGLNPY